MTTRKYINLSLNNNLKASISNSQNTNRSSCSARDGQPSQ